MTPCYVRHETAPGVHADIPHEHERYDMSESKPSREVLDGIRGRLTAATPGPWEAEGRGEIGQHYSRPEPWKPVISTEVSCMSFCYGGSSAGVMEQADATFIAAAPTDVARLVAAVEAVLGLHTPDTYGECRQCHGGNGFYHAYPCPTVAAIEAALKEGE